MKRMFVFLGLLGLLATQPAASCRKKDKKTTVVKAHDAKETAGYARARSETK